MVFGNTYKKYIEKKIKMKLGVIVPYRKNGHLRKFRESIESYLKDQDYELIVVEQNDDLPFNRGKLLI